MFYFFYKRESAIQVGFRDNKYGRCKKVETRDQKKLINLKWGTDGYIFNVEGFEWRVQACDTFLSRGWPGRAAAV